MAYILHPTEEEFAEGLAYLAANLDALRQYGICKIVPPDSWTLPSILNFQAACFQTRVQHPARLSHRRANEISLQEQLRRFWSERGRDIHWDAVKGKLTLLHDAVEALGGFETVSRAGLWTQIALEVGVDRPEQWYAKWLERFVSEREDPGRGEKRRKIVQNKNYKPCTSCRGKDWNDRMVSCYECDKQYHDFCLPSIPDDVEHWKCIKCRLESGESYGYEDGYVYTLDEFRACAQQLHEAIAMDPVVQKHGKLDEMNLEQLKKVYWELVESESDVFVEYGSDVDTMSFGSGFNEDAVYAWNLNDFVSNPLSILRYMDDTSVSGITRPWLYIGMLFASFAWHVEDFCLYSVNYLHFGAPKQWYGVPTKDMKKFEDVMQQHFPDVFARDPDILCSLVTMLAPEKLREEGIEVFSFVQNPHEFVFTLPGAYHGGFNTGFNCAESVNFALNDWIPHGVRSLQYLKKLRRSPPFSLERLLVSAAGGIYTSTSACWLLPGLYFILRTEHYNRKNIYSATCANWKYVEKRESKCAICKCWAYLSSVSCVCSKRVACLEHFKELCQCSSSFKTIRYHLTLADLDDILESIEVRAKSDPSFHKITDEWKEIMSDIETVPNPNFDMTTLIRDAHNWIRKTRLFLEQKDEVETSTWESHLDLAERFLWMDSSVDFLRSFIIDNVEE